MTGPFFGLVATTLGTGFASTFLTTFNCGAGLPFAWTRVGFFVVWLINDAWLVDLPDGFANDGLPDDLATVVTEDLTEGLTEGLTGDLPEGLTEDLPEALTEDLPEALTEDLPEALTEDLPEALTEDLPFVAFTTGFRAAAFFATGRDGLRAGFRAVDFADFADFVDFVGLLGMFRSGFEGGVVGAKQVDGAHPAPSSHR